VGLIKNLAQALMPRRRGGSGAASATEKLPAGIRKSSTFFPEIESLRGIAIVLVYLHHVDALVASPDWGPRAPFLGWAFVTAGHTGVSLFFVLSAFLLSVPFLKEAAGGKRVGRVDFYERRALRILPLYYTAAVVGSIVVAGNVGGVLHAVPYLFFLNSVEGWTTSLAPFSNVWWSLATEFQFYLLLPVLPLFLRTRRGRIAGLAALIVYACAYATFVLQWWEISTFEAGLSLCFSVFGRGPAFLLGISAAWMYLRFGGRIRQWLAQVPWMRLGGADVVFLTTWLVMAFLLRWLTLFGYWLAEGQPLHVWHIAEAFLWTAIMLQMLLSPLRTKTIFDNRVLARLGTLSYSIYILHLPVISYAMMLLRQKYPFLPRGWNRTSVVAIAAMSIACYVLSELTYRRIERPFLLRKAKLGRPDAPAATGGRESAPPVPGGGPLFDP